MRLGYIGLGNLGGHLAASLVRAGYQVTVHDLHREAATRLLEAGATWADSPEDVARASDSVITCLPSPAAVTAVVTGDTGILAGMKPGDTWIDMSTNDLHELRRLAARAADGGVACLEAPVTGGVHRAAAGEITVLVGGDEEIFATHLPVFQTMGGKVFYIGALGQASVMKVITNMLAFIHIYASGEALMLAKQGGIDLNLAYDVIRASSGTSFIFETETQPILSGSYDIGFSLELSCKDLHFAYELGRDFGVPLEVAGLVEQLNLRARSKYGGSAHSPMVVKLLEDAVGTELRAPGFPHNLQEYLEGRSRE